MTCIVGFARDGEVVIGGDSAGISNYDRRIVAYPKVFKRTFFVIGYTSSFRMGQLLQYTLAVPLQKKEQTDHEFMCTTFIDAVKKCLKDGEYATKSNDVLTGGTFLVGYRGNIYKVCDDFQVFKSTEGYEACGCGDRYALGAIRTHLALQPKANLNSIVINALEIATHFSAGVHGPFDLVSDKSK